MIRRPAIRCPQLLVTLSAGKPETNLSHFRIRDVCYLCLFFVCSNGLQRGSQLNTL